MNILNLFYVIGAALGLFGFFGVGIWGMVASELRSKRRDALMEKQSRELHELQLLTLKKLSDAQLKLIESVKPPKQPWEE